MKHGSLFSGIGGFDLAAEWMGWENIFHCEWIEEKRNLLNHYWPNAKSYEDITQTDFTIHRGDIDVLSGGFPCQNLSISNQSKTATGLKGEKSGLWSHFNRAIKEISPRVVVIENSPQLLRKGFERLLYDLSESGYNAEWRCVLATNLGFIHQRKRIFVVAYSKSLGRIEESFFQSYLHESDKQRQRSINSVPIETIRYKYPELPEDLLLDDGIPIELSSIESAIHGYGNAIVPQVALQIFKAIEQTQLFKSTLA